MLGFCTPCQCAASNVHASILSASYQSPRITKRHFSRRSLCLRIFRIRSRHVPCYPPFCGFASFSLSWHSLVPRYPSYFCLVHRICPHMLCSFRCMLSLPSRLRLPVFFLQVAEFCGLHEELSTADREALASQYLKQYHDSLPLKSELRSSERGGHKHQLLGAE